MVRTGILTVGPNTSRLDGVLLAIAGGGPNELAAATNFLQGSGFVTGNRARLTGDSGTIGAQTVIFMTRVEHAIAANTVANFKKSLAVSDLAKTLFVAKASTKGPLKIAKNKTAKNKTAKKKAAKKKAAKKR